MGPDFEGSFKYKQEGGRKEGRKGGVTGRGPGQIGQPADVRLAPVFPD